MKIEELTELHYITDIRNAGSILTYGVLSKERADKLKPHSFAMDSVQQIRARKKLPNGLTVHQHAVLYLWARNVALFKIVCEKRVPLDSLCILRIKPLVMNLPDAFMSDRNATCTMARFGTVEQMIPKLDWQRIKAPVWVHDDPIETQRHAEEMCAELLVPDFISCKFVAGAYVPTEIARRNLVEAAPGLPVFAAKKLFFPSKW